MRTRAHTCCTHARTRTHRSLVVLPGLDHSSFCPGFHVPGDVWPADVRFHRTFHQMFYRTFYRTLYRTFHRISHRIFPASARLAVQVRAHTRLHQVSFEEGASAAAEATAAFLHLHMPQPSSVQARVRACMHTYAPTSTLLFCLHMCVCISTTRRPHLR